MFTPKSREYYISKCLFYNGNDDLESYNIHHRIIANRERHWVDAHYNPKALNDLREQLKQYKAFGLGHFNSKDDIPITLKVTYWILWLKECEGLGTAEDFKEAYRRIFAEYAISKCRYYRGEDECPKETGKFPNGGYYWDIERGWILENHYHYPSEEYVQEYMAYVKPEVPEEYGIPLSLLAEIFHRVSKWSFSLANLGAEFRELIETEYMGYWAPQEWQHFPLIS